MLRLWKSLFLQMRLYGDCMTLILQNKHHDIIYDNAQREKRNRYLYSPLLNSMGGIRMARCPSPYSRQGRIWALFRVRSWVGELYIGLDRPRQWYTKHHLNCDIHTTFSEENFLTWYRISVVVSNHSLDWPH